MDKFDLEFFEEYTDKLRKSFLRVEKPQNDWRVILISNFLILVLFTVFSFYLFVQISADDIFISTEEESVSIDSLNRNLLNETIDEFRAKSNQFSEIQSRKPKVIDPSG